MSQDRLQRVAVIGAGGKMGRGIALLLAREQLRSHYGKKTSSEPPRLTLVDRARESELGLRDYIATQVAKWAKKNTSNLSGLKDVPQALDRLIRFSTDLDQASAADLVFEAATEDEQLKIEILSQLGKAAPAAFFCTNTSSIPIGVLDRAARLGGRIIGFHFYNPPAVQPLVELICAPGTRPELRQLASQLCRRLDKIVVPARDIAGFIGNGHFIRDCLYALGVLQRLEGELPSEQAIYAVDRISKRWLIRPMGIFQLMDYVGLDVVDLIGTVMSRHIASEELNHPRLKKLLQSDIRGGQNADGSQRAGFFSYEQRTPVAVLSADRTDYIPLNAGLSQQVEAWLGSSLVPPAWKDLRQDPNATQRLDAYLAELATATGRGAELARAHLKASSSIGEKLIAEGVAELSQQVDSVLIRGFHHLYGPFYPLPF